MQSDVGSVAHSFDDSMIVMIPRNGTENEWERCGGWDYLVMLKGNSIVFYFRFDVSGKEQEQSKKNEMKFDYALCLVDHEVEVPKYLVVGCIN